MIVPASSSVPWSLAVVTRQGPRFVVEHPAAGDHLFDGEVSMAALTDAMDNDWVAMEDER